MMTVEFQSSKTSFSFKAFETARGARIFRLPLNVFPDFWAYAYLVLVDDLIVLIDTGSGFGRSNAHLEAGFEQAGSALGRKIRLEDLTYIFITHGHIDHFGGLVFLRERTKAQVGVHELDLGILTNYEQRLAIAEKKLRAYLIEAGVGGNKIEDFLNLYRVNKVLFHSTQVDFTYESSQMRLEPFEMLHVPGHCAGHVVIRLHDILFSGDHVLARITPHQSPESLTLFTGLGHYLDSLAQLEMWVGNPSLTLAGHDDPIPDLPSRLAEIRSAHAARLERTFQFLTEAHTILEVSKELFGKVTGYNTLLAIEEAGAHVEYLHQRGRLRIDNMAEIESSEKPLITYYRCVDQLGVKELGHT